MKDCVCRRSEWEEFFCAWLKCGLLSEDLAVTIGRAECAGYGVPADFDDQDRVRAATKPPRPIRDDLPESLK